MKRYLTYEQIMEMAVDRLDVLVPSGDHIVTYAEKLELDYDEECGEYYTTDVNVQEIAAEIISTIKPNPANLEYIASTGKINGSLHADIIKCMIDFHNKMKP